MSINEYEESEIIKVFNDYDDELKRKYILDNLFHLSGYKYFNNNIEYEGYMMIAKKINNKNYKNFFKGFAKFSRFVKIYGKTSPYYHGNRLLFGCEYEDIFKDDFGLTEFKLSGIPEANLFIGLSYLAVCNHYLHSKDKFLLPKEYFLKCNNWKSYYFLAEYLSFNDNEKKYYTKKVGKKRYLLNTHEEGSVLKKISNNKHKYYLKGIIDYKNEYIMEQILYQLLELNNTKTLAAKIYFRIYTKWGRHYKINNIEFIKFILLKF